MSDQLDAIAAGWNVAQMSLTLLTSISVDGVYFAGPEVIPHYDPGVIKFRGDGLIKTLGYPNVTWLEGILTYNQWAYLSTTYCDSGMSGKVTIYTNVGSTSYVRLNAILTLPVPEQMSARNWYTKAGVKMTHLEPAS